MIRADAATDEHVATLIAITVGVLSILAALWRISVTWAATRSDLARLGDDLRDRAAASTAEHSTLREHDTRLDREFVTAVAIGIAIGIAMTAFGLRTQEKLTMHERWHHDR